MKRRNSMRKVYVKATFKLILNIEEGTSVEDVMGELNYDFSPADFHEDQAELVDTEMEDWQILDSK